MANCLLEILTEEIPARFMPGFLNDLKEKAESALSANRLKYSKIETYGTYKRLVLYIEGLSDKQEDRTEERKGPPKDRAYDKDGKPTQTAIGFAKKSGIEVSDLLVKAHEGKEYVFASVFEKGIETKELLKKIYPEIITSLYLPLAMRWGEGDFKFIRPIHGLLALFGNKVVEFELAGIKSGDSTLGHRFFGSEKPIKISSADIKNYKSILLKSKVLVDQIERKEKVKNEVVEAAKKIGEALVEEDLLDEVTYLVEFPSAAIGKFNQKYLGLPKDVLITSMKKNQKYFPVIDKGGKLLPNFIVVADGLDKRGAEAIILGNERVLTARLSDAAFFFEEDKRIPLKDRVPALKGVAFYEKLGNLFEKKDRIIKLSEYLAKRLAAPEENKKRVLKVAELCKADLTTQMVFEFTSLQGVMGREYALVQGEEASVANGIYEHYLPKFAGDDLPSSIEGIIVSLADRIDSIVGCFSIGLIPTGSQDPYMLRRQAHGIVEIILKKKLDILLDEAIEKSYKFYEPIFLEYLFKNGETGYKDYEKIKNSVLDFLAARLKVILEGEGIRYDIIDAALGNFNDIADAYEKAKILMKHTGSDWLKGVVMTADRINRIAVNAKREQVIEADFIEEDEKKMHELYLKINWAVGEAIENGHFEKAMQELSKMTDPTEDFFNKVLIMHKDEKVKLNRLALLKSMEKMFMNVADFAKIVV